MTQYILELKAALEHCFNAQLHFTAYWHTHKPEMPPVSEGDDLQCLSSLVLQQHFFNYQLWHVEDTARRRDVDDTVIADCKRTIDGLNQQRNNGMEAVDKCLYALIAPYLPKNATTRQNTETVGMSIDRLSILALKIYHMDEQTKRVNVDDAHRKSCAAKLAVLERQRNDLVTAVLELIADYVDGIKIPALYAQFKMYNDPALNPELYGKKA